MPRAAFRWIFLAAALAAATAAPAQQPPSGAPRPPPPPGFGHPPPPPPPGAQQGPQFQPPPQPQQQFQSQPFQPQPAPAQGLVPVETPLPVPAAPRRPSDPSSLPVAPFPQLSRDDATASAAAAPAPASGNVGAAPLRADVVALLPADSGPQPLPRWLWLLAAACLLAFAGWRAALRKSRVLGDEAERLARKQRQLQSAHVQLKTQSDHLRQMATNDPLTGTLNRQAFANELRMVLEHLARFRRPLNLMLFDMDNFKQINDQQGHLVGDQALKMVAGVVREHLASEDLFGRFGGDEFLIACADQPLEETQALAEAIRAAVVRAAAKHEPSLAGLSLSIGIAQANETQGYQAELLFQRADTALYTAKRTGRNRVILADDSLPPPPVLETATRHLA